ncbi:hypothetical protein V8G54_004621 [Vigna mungo]|uniref:Poly [ADP-ribose] polymerase n=1 Tax=Vigna mungo TaxID=3915 RepID=A0AAQ3PH71_VIGMU
MQRIENCVGKGLTKVEKESEEYESIKNGFLKGMGFMGNATTIIAIHKNDVSFSLARQARWDSFNIFSKAVAIKSGGDANVRNAWYGGSLDDLLEIVSVGFSGCKSHDDHDESHGVGIPLFSVHSSIDSAMCTVADEHGVRHVLLCRVILGKMEAVGCGSKQSQPSSKQYDSDSVVHGALKPQSPYVLFPNLLARVSNDLKPAEMTMLLRSYRIYRQRKISRQVWINRVRLIVGDTLLHSVITKSNYDVHIL